MFLKSKQFRKQNVMVINEIANFLCTIFSKILSKIECREIGLKLLKSWVEPPLWRRITSAKIPEEREE